MMVVTPANVADLKIRSGCPKCIDEMIKDGDFIVVSECEIDADN